MNLWILNVFGISSFLGIEAIVGLFSIYLYFWKLSRKHQLRIATLLSNHAIRSLLENKHAHNTCYYCLSLENITPKQWLKIKSSIINSNNCFDEIFLSFDTFHNEFFPGSRLIDHFSSCLSFHKISHKDKESKNAHLWELDKIMLETSSNPNLVIVFLDASIKDNITT